MALDLTQLAVLGFLSSLPPEDQAKTKECIAKLEAVLAEYPEHGLLALALIGAAKNAESDR